MKHTNYKKQTKNKMKLLTNESLNFAPTVITKFNKKTN